MHELADIINKVHCADCLEFMRKLPGQVLDIHKYCPKCGEPRPSCVCEIACHTCGNPSNTVSYCPYCFEEHCTDCITECPREAEK